MKLSKKVLCAALSAAFCLAGLTGCGTTQGENPSETPDAAVTSAAPAAETTAPPVESATASPEPQATPTQEVAQTDLKQLNLGENFMQPRALGDIDPLNDKVVALTFDDGPHPENTDRLLEILKENDVTATFFVVGSMVEKNPDVLKRVYEAGHEIGNHSYDHPDFSKLTADEMTEQYRKTNDIVEEVIGKRTLIDRPPGGAVTDEKAEQIGREQILWIVDPEDWKKDNRDPDIVYDNVINGTNTGTPVRDGAIVLSHDIHATTIDAYDRIIKELKAQGYQFVTVTQMIQIAEARGKEIGYRFNGAPEIPVETGTEAPPTESMEPPSTESAPEVPAGESTEAPTEVG